MSAPVEIHTLSDSLEALSHTLLRIQQTSRQLSSSYQVPDQFSRRLEACLAQLAIHASEIKKVDTMLDTTAVVKGSQKKRIKRSAERIKWLGYGSHKMDCFLKDLRMYQSEFSLELSAMLLYENPIRTHC